MQAERSSLSGRVAIVTGGTRGIGKAIALALGGAGACVLVVGRKEAGVSVVAAELAAAGIRGAGVTANVSKDADLQTIVQRAISEFGMLDIVVNNAAVNPVFGPVENTGIDAFEKIMTVNVRAPFELAKLALPHFKARGGGVILNISSIGGVSPESNLGIYSVSKAAIISLTKVLAREWGKDNVRANVICPGLIRTGFSSALWENEKILTHTLRRQAIARLGEPDDVASLALLLCSDAGAFCTGGVYVADGGYTI